MSKTVFTGWRTLTPGKCLICGCDGDWECDGRGTVTCSCQRMDDYVERDDEGPTSQPEDPDPRYDDEGGF